MGRRVRSAFQIRRLAFRRRFTSSAPGSVLVSWGRTKVLCTVSYEEKVPPFVDPEREGWLTAEYRMLPGSTEPRKVRESTRGRLEGRTMEIQRLIGRSLRAMVDLERMPGVTLWVDCDVLQADGGTRTASINGGCVAVVDALSRMVKEGILQENPLVDMVGAVSVGVVDGEILVDLDYEEDSSARMDMNVVATSDGKLVEIQGTAEKGGVPRSTVKRLMDAAMDALEEIFDLQKKALGMQP